MIQEVRTWSRLDFLRFTLGGGVLICVGLWVMTRWLLFFLFLRYTPSPRGAGLVFTVVFPSLKYALPLEVSLVFLKLGASSFPSYVLLLLDFIRRCGDFRLYAALRLRLVMCGDFRLL